MLISLLENGTYVNHGVFLLEDGARDWALTLIVQPIRIGAVLNQELHELRVPVIRCEHQLWTVVLVSRIDSRSS